MNATRKYHTGAHAGSLAFSGGGWNIKELARNGLGGQSEVEAWRRHACVANSPAPPSSRSAPQPAEKHTHTHTHARTCTRAHTHGHQVLSALGGRSLPERSTTMFRWTPTVPKSWATAHGAPSQPTNGQQSSHSQPTNKHKGGSAEGIGRLNQCDRGERCLFGGHQRHACSCVQCRLMHRL